MEGFQRRFDFLLDQGAQRSDRIARRRIELHEIEPFAQRVVVALTADAFEDDRRACLAAGMDDFLVKPLTPDTLRAALLRWTSPVQAVKVAV